MDKHQLTMILTHGNRISGAIDRDGRGLSTRLCVHTIKHLAEIRYELFCFQFPPFIVDNENIKKALTYVDHALSYANTGRRFARPEGKRLARRKAYEACMMASTLLDDELTKIADYCG